MGMDDPPGDMGITKIDSIEDAEEGALVFACDKSIVDWENVSANRMYIVSDLPISSPLPNGLAGVIPNDPMVIGAICNLYTEMTNSYDLGDKLIQSLGEKNLLVREKQEAMLRHSRRYKAMVKHATDLIFLLGPSGKIVFSNETLNQYMGGGRVISRSFLEIVHEDDRPKIEEMVRKNFKEGITSKIECRLMYANERVRTFSLIGTPLIEDKRIYGLSVIGRDITDIRIMQEKLSVQTSDLSSMINGVSHELRNPLMIIGAYAKRLERSNSSNANDRKIKSAFENMFSSISRIEDMVLRIERYGTIASLDDFYAEVNMKNLVDEVVRTLSSYVPVEVQDDLNGLIYTEPDHLKIALSRVMENAFESGTDHIEVHIFMHTQYVYLSVRDFGCGAGMDLDAIFAPFFSSDPMKVGLGLTEARISMVKMGGKIEAVPGIEPGSNFLLKVPRDRRILSRQT